MQSAPPAQTDAFLAIDTTSGPFVVVENLTSQPLIDINISLKSGILVFSDTIGRLEAKEKRQIRHSDFSSRDGTSFSLRIAQAEGHLRHGEEPGRQAARIHVPLAVTASPTRGRGPSAPRSPGGSSRL